MDRVQCRLKKRPFQCNHNYRGRRYRGQDESHTEQCEERDDVRTAVPGGDSQRTVTTIPPEKRASSVSFIHVPSMPRMTRGHHECSNTEDGENEEQE